MPYSVFKRSNSRKCTGSEESKGLICFDLHTREEPARAGSLNVAFSDVDVAFSFPSARSSATGASKGQQIQLA